MNKHDLDALWSSMLLKKGNRPTLAMMVTDSILRNGIFSDGTLSAQILEASKVFDCRFCGATFSNAKDLIHKMNLLGNGDFDVLCIISKGSQVMDTLLNDTEVVEAVKCLPIPTISAIECNGERPAICAHTDRDFTDLHQFGAYLKSQAETLLPTAAPILAKAEEDAAQRKAERDAYRKAQEAARKQEAEDIEAIRRAAAAQQDRPTINPEQEVERLNGVLSGKVYEISKLKRKLRRRKISVVVAYVLLVLILATIATLYLTGIISINM